MTRLLIIALFLILVNAPAHACKFHEDQKKHQAMIEESQSSWEEEYKADSQGRSNRNQQRNDDRTAHQGHIVKYQNDWNDSWKNDASVRKNAEEQRNDDRAAHQSGIASQPERWWEGYSGNE